MKWLKIGNLMSTTLGSFEAPEVQNPLRVPVQDNCGHSWAEGNARGFQREHFKATNGAGKYLSLSLAIQNYHTKRRRQTRQVETAIWKQPHREIPSAKRKCPGGLDI